MKKEKKPRNKLLQKIKSHTIVKGKMSVHIPEFKAPSILGDPNRFFKDTLEQERRNMFLWYSIELLRGEEYE